MVVDELDKGTDGLVKWVKALEGFVCDHDASELTVVTQISTDHPDWVQNTKNEADPWLVAHAKFEKVGCGG